MMDEENIYLNIETVCEALGGSPSSRNFIEGERILRSKHLILCEATKKTSANIHIYALCLQTSALDTPPHTIEGILGLNKKRDVSVVKIQCSCKAGDSGKCKHIAATLLYCNRNDVSQFNILSSTDKKCLWKGKKGPALAQYEPKPLIESGCFERPLNNRSMPILSAEFKQMCLTTLLEAAPNSALTKHKTGRIHHSEDTTTEITRHNVLCDSSKEDMTSLNDFFTHIQSSNEIMNWLNELDIGPPHDCCLQFYESKIKCNDPVKLCQNTQVTVCEEYLMSKGPKNVRAREEWKKQRQFRITGSRCYSVYTYSREDWTKKAASYFWPTCYTNSNMLHGLRYEGVARKVYQNLNNKITVLETGLIVDTLNPWLAYSPDGIVLENGIPTKLLEIKCIVKGQEETVVEAIKSCKFVVAETSEDEKKKYKLKQKHPYYGQVQLGMALLNVDVTDFIVYASFDDSILTIEVQKDVSFKTVFIQT